MSNIIRIDKNVAHNILDFSIFGEDQTLIKNLIYYFCFAYQHNIFGFGKLDPYEFARAFKYQLPNLVGRHPSPKQLQGLSQQEIDSLYEAEEEDPTKRVWDSNLENALYLLKTTKVYFSNGGKIKSFDGKAMHYSEIREISFLNEVRVYFDGRKNKGEKKIFYTYELNQQFIDNLTSYYLKGDREVITQLRKPKLDDLYIYLKNLRDNLSLRQETKATVDFNLLCRIGQINIENSRDRKRKLKNKLDKLKDVSEFKFELRWERGGGRYRYKPVLEFEPRFQNKSEFDQYRHREKVQIFAQSFLHECINYFKKRYFTYYDHPDRDIHMLRWLQTGPEKDREAKAFAYQSACLKTWDYMPNPYDNKVINFINSLPNIESLDDLITVFNKQ